MDISSLRENSQTERSLSPKHPTSELEHKFNPRVKDTEPVVQKHETAGAVQEGSSEARVVEFNSINFEQLILPEESTKNAICKPSGPQLEGTIINSSVEAESVIRKISSPRQTTSDVNHEFGYESVSGEPLEQKQVIVSENVQNGPVETRMAECDHMGVEQVGPSSGEATRNSCWEQLRSPPKGLTMKSSLEQFGLPPENEATDSNLEQYGPPADDASKNPDLVQLGATQEDAVKNPSHLGHGEEGTSVRPRKGKNMIRPLVGSTRVLRSRSQEKSKAREPGNNLSEDGANREKGRRKKKKKLMKKNPVNEFSRIRTHLRYLLNRIKYEQSLIDAYSGEGWKGQSLEKIKPEKELQRAKSEIFRRKLKIRDLFQRLDMLCAEGRPSESLYDSQGEIDSEDIFCAKCGSKDLPADNDIILCDGACERGFHQFCLEPPLLKEEIPPDDVGWLCPACDCKIDCIDLLNDSEGTNLSISDSWEKVFPEAAAGNKLDNNFGLPSDDSEDDDYDPNGPELHEKVQGDELSSDESDLSSTSDDLGALPNDEQYLGLPSDDSEDDNYDPNALNLDEQVKPDSSSSDFTSDSEDFSAAVDERPLGEVQGPDHIKRNGERSQLGATRRQSLSDELSSLLQSDPGEGDAAPPSGKRHLERLDYKKLHDETYGNVSSDSSDEDYTDTAAPKKRKSNTGKVASVSPYRKTPIVKHGADAKDIGQKEHECTPRRISSDKEDVEGPSNSSAMSHKGSEEPDSSGKITSRSAYKRLGEDVTQRLLKSFKENQYPERAVKETLAKEVALTVHQVSKWFQNARHSLRTKLSTAEITSNKGTQINEKLPQPEPKMDTEDAACNMVGKKEQLETSPGVIECCSRDVRAGNLVIEEGQGQNSRTPESRRRKVKLDHQTTDPSMKETSNHSVQVKSPNAHEARRSARIQSKSVKSVS